MPIPCRALSLLLMLAAQADYGAAAVAQAGPDRRTSALAASVLGAKVVDSIMATLLAKVATTRSSCSIQVRHTACATISRWC